jgi:hypothetical protein
MAGIVPAPVEDPKVSVIKEPSISKKTLPPKEGDEKKKSVSFDFPRRFTESVFPQHRP